MVETLKEPSNTFAIAKRLRFLLHLLIVLLFLPRSRQAPSPYSTRDRSLSEFPSPHIPENFERREMKRDGVPPKFSRDSTNFFSRSEIESARSRGLSRDAILLLRLVGSSLFRIERKKTLAADKEDVCVRACVCVHSDRALSVHGVILVPLREPRETYRA